MTRKQLKELSDRLALVVADFDYYGFDFQEPKHQRKLAEDWLLPELENIIHAERD